MATFVELPACSLALSSSTSRRRRRDGRHTARRNLRLTSARLTASSYHLQLHEDNVARPVHGLASSPSSAGWPARSTTPSPTPRRRRRDCRRTARRHLHGCIYTTTSAGLPASSMAPSPTPQRQHRDSPDWRHLHLRDNVGAGLPAYGSASSPSPRRHRGTASV